MCVNKAFGTAILQNDKKNHFVDNHAGNDIIQHLKIDQESLNEVIINKLGLSYSLTRLTQLASSLCPFNYCSAWSILKMRLWTKGEH